MKWLWNQKIILTAFILTLTVLIVSGARVHADNEAGSDTGEIIVRVHGDGQVKLTDAQGKEYVVGTEEMAVNVPAHSYIRLDATSQEKETIAIAVTTKDGIELEPESVENTVSYAREITVSEVTKVVDVTFGKTVKKQARTAAGAARGSEQFPEAGDRFSGACTVYDVDGGNGHTVHGVTLNGFSGILSGDGNAEVDCSQHGAAAPVEGMKYNYTYTVLSVDKSSGTVRGNIFATSQTLAAVGTPGTDGYQRGYQSLSGIFTIHRDYNGRMNLKKVCANTQISQGNACYSLTGARYGVYTDALCTVQAATLTTQADGVTNTVELPVGRYYIKELAAPSGYALDSMVYTADIASDQTVSVTAKDRPQNAPVSLVLSKKDSETGESLPQGAATLEGAEFTIRYYDGFYDSDPAEQGIDPERSWIMKTDQEGKVRLKDELKISGDSFYKNSAGVNTLPLGTVTIRETKAAEGYLINDTVYVRQITSSGNTETVHTYQDVIVPEKVVRGDLRLVKFKGDLEEENDQKIPLKGIVFEITSKTTGETVEIVTDENGYASTEQIGHERGGLVYDTYIVHEKNTPDGLIQVRDFEIAISEEGQTLYYILEDKVLTTPVRLVKTDSTSGKTIPAENIKFRLLDQEKNIIKMTTYYPKKEEHEIFQTDADGRFILPDRLPAGEYYFREIEAPCGYLLEREDIKFIIKENHDWDNPLEVSFPNRPAMGRLHVTKTDTETGKLLPGAEFTVTAIGDVITPDGTLRAKDGEVVATIVTDQRGEAQTEDLFLGKYRVAESAQPSGYVKPDKTWEVELAYKDQYTEVVLEQLEIENTPSEIVIDKIETGSDRHLPGVIFEVWNKAAEEADGAENAALDVIDPEMGTRETVVTGADGTVTLKYLTPGTYCIREIETIPGYVPDHTIYEFTVDEDGKTVGNETGFITVENDATVITGTSVHNIATDDRHAAPGLVEAVDTVSIENLRPGATYQIKGVLVNQKTGEPLWERSDKERTVLMSEVEFTADAPVMDVEVRFSFNAAELEGWTISVFEYLYQDGVEISSHTDLDDDRQQLHIRNADIPEQKNDGKRAPRTGDFDHPLAAAACCVFFGSAALGLAACRRKRGKRSEA
nr:SpaA isopeptide-forming pilin-related protein [uncultured Mediterraneibacter sp.]